MSSLMPWFLAAETGTTSTPNSRERVLMSDTLEHITAEMETALGTDREAALADMRYNYIERRRRWAAWPSRT